MKRVDCAPEFWPPTGSEEYERLKEEEGWSEEILAELRVMHFRRKILEAESAKKKVRDVTLTELAFGILGLLLTVIFLPVLVIYVLGAKFRRS